jgi:hypothetical protein
MFKLWSQLNKEALKELKPDFNFRNWAELSYDEKYKIWKHLENYFFDKDVKKPYRENPFYRFLGEYQETINKKRRIIFSIEKLNEEYKAKSYGREFLENRTENSACADFYSIFMEESENVVLEMLSNYSMSLILQGKKNTIYRKESEEDEDFQKRKEIENWQEFEKFTEDVNDVFISFGLNVQLTRLGFIPLQERKIMEEIYKPVLEFLSHDKWKKVNEILSDALSDYRKNTPQGYSGCLTKIISATEAFLQILVEGKIGGTKFSQLLQKKEFQKDIFTQTIFKNIDSIFARERKSVGDAHPKDDYATEKNARMILNLAMIFMQHCVQK